MIFEEDIAQKICLEQLSLRRFYISKKIKKIFIVNEKRKPNNSIYSIYHVFSLTYKFYMHSTFTVADIFNDTYVFPNSQYIFLDSLIFYENSHLCVCLIGIRFTISLHAHYNSYLICYNMNSSWHHSNGKPFILYSLLTFSSL